MPVDLVWLRAESARLGLALSEDDLAEIRDTLEKTRATLAAARLRDPPQWDDPPAEFIPPFRRPAS